VADDCLYTGRASSQLVQLAASLGAERILVVPLIARLNDEQLEHWESLRTLSFQQNKFIEICYVFPLVLPIPEYNASDCPYEMTEKRLQRWKGISLPLEKEELISLKQIEAQPPNRSRRHPQEFTETWLRIRTYAELASEHQIALELLNKELSVKNPNARLAILTLFLEEWNLLGRARLRQSTRPLLRKLAIDSLLSDDATFDERIMAFSLIRSLYPESFVEYLPYATSYIEKNIDFLGRIILQISSLPPDLRRDSNCVSLLTHITSQTRAFQQSFDSTHDERLAGLLNVSQQLLLNDRPLSPEKKTKRQAFLTLVDLLKKDPSLTHDARSITEVIGKGQGLKDFTTDTFKHLALRWQEHNEHLFQSHIIPLLSNIEPLILLTMSIGSPLASKESEYFTDVNSPHGDLTIDLASFIWSLKALSEDTKRDIVVKTVANSAKRLYDNVLGTTSLLSRILSTMYGPSISEFLSTIESEISSTITSEIPPEIIVSGIETVESGRLIFCPSVIARRGISTIVGNLRKHAFIGDMADHSRIKIEVSQEHIDSTPSVSFKIYDNGESLKEPVITSFASKRVAEDIRHFEGELYPPASASESSWNVVQQIDFKLC